MNESGFIKKRSNLIPRRTIFAAQDTTDINSTQSMNNEPEVVISIPRRKSCFVAKEKMSFQALQASAGKNKGRPSIGGKTGFKGRTLMMVDGRRNAAAGGSAISRLPLRPSQPKPRVRPIRFNPLPVKSTPLHMSTPCDPPRSILKTMADVPPRPTSAAKRVNFDSAQEDDGMFPLEDSTIHTFNNILSKMPVIQKVDASTSTDFAIEPTPVNNTDETDENSKLALILKQMEKNIIAAFNEKLSSLSTKVELLEKNNTCPCKSPVVPESVAKSYHKFVSQLDDINEVSETVTPSIDEASRSVTPSTTEAYDDSETPKCANTVSEATKSTDLSVPVQQLTPPQEQEEVDMVDAVPTVESSIQNDCLDDTEKENEIDNQQGRKNLISKRRSSRVKMVSSPMLDSSDSGPCLRPRITRKRAIPKYLQTFQLSPRSK